MKRFHIHLSVPVLDQAIDFYSRLFAAEPTVQKTNYAKWMIDDPCLNFAVSASTREENTGVDHLGIQVETESELKQLNARLRETRTEIEDQKGIECCYAVGDKHMVTDPAGLPWEAFHTTGESSRW